MIRVGASSGSFPELSATQAAAYVARHGGSVVDLRVGKGHRWEEEGAAPFLDVGLEIAFVGIDLHLGKHAYDPLADRAATLAPGSPVKVFCDAGSAGSPDAITAFAVLAERFGGPEQVLLETHAGGADVATLLWWASEQCASVLVDSLGLTQISEHPLADAARLSACVQHAQVKGFADGGAGIRHRPLAEDAGWHERLLGALPGLKTVTVESRAGQLGADITTATALVSRDLGGPNSASSNYW